MPKRAYGIALLVYHNPIHHVDVCGCVSVPAAADANDQSETTQITLISVLVLVDTVPNLDRRVNRLRARYDFLHHYTTYHCFGINVSVDDIGRFFSLAVAQSSNVRMRVSRCGDVLSVVLPCDSARYTADAVRGALYHAPLADFLVTALDTMCAVLDIMYRRASGRPRL